MLSIYRFLLRGINFSVNVLFVAQIILMILVFLTATYWLMDLLGFYQFDFLQPLADGIVAVVHKYYNREVEVGGVIFDGALLLFDIVAMVVVFILSKIKVFLYETMEDVQAKIDFCLGKIESAFNARLEQEMKNKIKKMNNIAVLVEFSAANTLVDGRWGGDEEDGVEVKESQAFKEFIDALKVFPNCRLAKTDNKMLILSKDFMDIDKFMEHIEDTINKTRREMRTKRWKLSSYIGVEVYDNHADFKKDIYPNLQHLLSLRVENEALCLGNFKLRYELELNQKYNISLKGKYGLASEQTDSVWSLVRKTNYNNY